MSRRRVRITEQDYRELLQGKDWALKNGLDGTAAWYDQMIEFHASRRALPPSAMATRRNDDEDRPRHGRDR